MRAADAELVQKSPTDVHESDANQYNTFAMCGEDVSAAAAQKVSFFRKKC